MESNKTPTKADGSKAASLHYNTPCLLSESISKFTGFETYMKLDNLQPGGSFKIRGIGYFCQKAKENGAKKFACSSGGNAGIAAAYAARKLNMPILIVLPKSAPSFVADILKSEGAKVEIFGNNFDEANLKSTQIAKEEGLTHIHAFDHPDVWEGHSTLITEAAEQLDKKPDVIIVCVGGGGLLIGIVEGMTKIGWEDVPVIAMETKGADCYNKAIEKGSLVTLPGITSIAKCLGALTAAETALEVYKKYKIISVVVEDKEAINACLQFLADERMMVEPSCGATLAAIYSGVIKKLQKEGKLGCIKSALAIVCGGKLVSLDLLQAWKEQFGL